MRMNASSRSSLSAPPPPDTPTALEGCFRIGERLSLPSFFAIQFVSRLFSPPDPPCLPPAGLRPLSSHSLFFRPPAPLSPKCFHSALFATSFPFPYCSFEKGLAKKGGGGGRTEVFEYGLNQISLPHSQPPSLPPPFSSPGLKSSTGLPLRIFSKLACIRPSIWEVY